MEPLNSGGSLELWDQQQGWIPFQEAYLTEGYEYKLRCKGEVPDVRIHGMPIPLYQKPDGWYGVFLAPFQSGTLKVLVNGEEYESFIYPDQRKLTEEQFVTMLREVMEEAGSCFQYSGLERRVDVSGRSRSVSWTQWSYLERSFYQLRQLYSKIQEQPLRKLQKVVVNNRREKVQRPEAGMLRWLDRSGHGDNVPQIVESTQLYESLDVYENTVLKQQILDLSRMLGSYEKVHFEAVAQKARKYRTIVNRWMASPFFKEITANQGSYSITQKFRKHPVYRLWYKWFDSLYKHGNEGIGFDYPIALKDTFQLYEMWCFMKIVKLLRNAGLVKETAGIYKMTNDGLFLNLAENQESHIKLMDGVSLFFQRTYQYNSRDFHTYTQRMIPDIVLESEKRIIVFDPKYRVPGNLGTALGEMHKYRDGILHRNTGEKAVSEVYILTPTKADHAEVLRYFQEEFHLAYRMGAVQLVPEESAEKFERKIVSCFYDLYS